MLKSIWNRMGAFIYIYVFPFSLTLSRAASNWKSLNYETSHEKKNWTHEIPMRKNFGSTKCQQKKVLNPWNTHEKYISTRKIPSRKTLEPTKYTHKNFLNKRYTNKKNSVPQNIKDEKFWTHEIPTKALWHNGTTPATPTMLRDPLNFAQW